MTLSYSDHVDERPATARLNILLYLFYMSGFLLTIGAFNLILSGQDLRIPAEADAGSPVSQSMLAVVFLGSLLLFSVSPYARTILQRSWPVLLLPVMALLSALWSPDPALTMRRAIALVGTVILGLSLASTYTRSDAAVLIVRTLTVAMILSCIFVFVIPRYGIHQATDANQPEHAGLWRGIFAHRNVLGFCAGINAGLLVIYARDAFRSLILRGIAIAATLACLLGARSGTSFVLLALMVICTAALMNLRRRPPEVRMQNAIGYVIVGFIALLFAKPLFEIILELLGKSSNLTGRTEIWSDVLQYMSDSSPLLGYGYFAGYVQLEKELASLNHGSYGSAHNAYLQALVYFGYPGLIIFIGTIVWFGVTALRAALVYANDRAYLFPIVILAVLATTSFAESYLTEAVSLSALLFSIVAGMLGRDGDSMEQVAASS